MFDCLNNIRIDKIKYLDQIFFIDLNLDFYGLKVATGEKTLSTHWHFGFSKNNYKYKKNRYIFCIHNNKLILGKNKMNQKKFIELF